MEKMYATNPGLQILRHSPHYKTYVETVPLDSFAIKCILESHEACRAASLEHCETNRPAFSI